MVPNCAKHLICCSLFILTGEWGLSMFLLRIFLRSFYLKLQCVCQKRSVCLVFGELTFFYQLFCCPKGNFRSLMRRQSHSSGVNHNVISCSTRISPGTRNDMSNDIFREVFMIGGKRYVGATFNKNKLNVICNIFNLIKYFSWKPKF